MTTLHAQPADTIANENTTSHNALQRAVIGSAAVYSLSMAGLYHMWYRHAESQPFAFFNDNAEWKQVDKAGHFYSSFYLTYGISRGLQHYGVSERKADLYAAISSFGALLPIEIFDGHSTAYGASVGDLLANASGPMLYLAQKSLWSEIRIYPKFSFHFSPYSSLRPELLGTGAERIIKDYNGQTYWLCADTDRFMKFPRWLNIAIGYGAEGMIFARDQQHIAAGYPKPFRQFYLSIDPDLRAIKTRSKTVKTLIFFASMIKLPAPAVSFSRKGTEFHPFYF